MNRPIKFRAWDTKNKNWLTAVPSLEYLLDDEDAAVSHHDYDVEDAVYFYPNSPLGNDFRGRIIYEQFTGLLDKNGREIYEGDILKENLSYNESMGGQLGPILAPVSYSNGCFWFGMEPLFQAIEGKLEVIGNIHENPELLV